MRQLPVLSASLIFPPAEEADEEGLLAIGGDLSVERLILAYRKGIFPWYDGPIPLWWHPDPRFVLFPDQLLISKSMRQIIRRNEFTLTRNKAFARVIANCKTIPRKDQDGTWISDEIKEAYTQLHEKGLAHSFEAWQNNELVGGLYGIKMGKVFFGESMFSHVSNASKAAFIHAVHQLQNEGVVLIDCQVYTQHLASLGAGFISRKAFMEFLAQNLD